MKNYLLPKSGTYYKANLHSHSTLSDGRFTPEELKESYKAKGYSVFAYTDHEAMIPHPELKDDDFLPLTGVEYAISNEIPHPYGLTCHICMIALDPDTVVQPLYNEERLSYRLYQKMRPLIKLDETSVHHKHVYSQENINEIMRIGREKGFFVTYNHPTWSMENYSQYSGYEGMHAMEICNYGCVVLGYDEHNGHVYDDLVRQGKRIFCVATDDNHILEHQFGGFTMIKAEKLEYKTITDALVKGNFYASEGPMIHDLWYEDGKVHITCEPAREITITKGTRRSKGVKAQDGLITEASFDVLEDDIYFRLTVIGEDGTKAYTNAYFMDTLK